MSIVFNGTTSELEWTAMGGFDVDTITICAWVYANGAGESNIGRVICYPETGSGSRINHTVTANTLNWVYDFTTTDGVWTYTVTDNQWNAVAVSYDRTSTTNDPTVRVNFASASTTETATPAGTGQVASTGVSIGNRSDAAATWNGRIQHVQAFNVILNANEMDSALRRPGSIIRGLFFWAPMFHASYTTEVITGTAAPVALNLATGDSAPCQAPWSNVRPWVPYTVPVGAGQPTMRRWGHVRHMSTTRPVLSGIR